jgi:hypothetical protein
MRHCYERYGKAKNDTAIEKGSYHIDNICNFSFL